MKRLTRGLALATALLIVLSACGGGGGGGTVGDPPPSPAPPTQPDFPKLETSSAFKLEALEAPPERPMPELGVQQGRVWLTPDLLAPAGLKVEWLDATRPDSPVVIAFGVTDGQGGFSLKASPPAMVVPALSQWLRVTLVDGSTLRAYANAWSELSPATEVAVREIARLNKAGSFWRRPLEAAELTAAQQSLTIGWQGGSLGATSGPDTINAMLRFVRFHAPWNQLLDDLARSQVSQFSGDVAGLFPRIGASYKVSLRFGSPPSAARDLKLYSDCFEGPPGVYGYSCVSANGDDRSFVDLYAWQRRGLELVNVPRDESSLSQVLAQLGPLPLLDFPFTPGLRMLADDPKFVLKINPLIHASVRISRRTYPLQMLEALGGKVPAVQVALDYEIALLDTKTGKQTDHLKRERRWFSPMGGRVKTEVSALQRDGAQITAELGEFVAQSVEGKFFAAPMLPFAGVVDQVVLPLRHRHAVYSAALNRVYAATDEAGGQVLELDPSNLKTLRTLATGGVPGRLAVSADGSRLYAGLDGAILVEWDVATFQKIRQTPTQQRDGPSGHPYDRVYDLAVDPFDTARVLVLLGTSARSDETGPVALYRDGQLLMIDTPRFNAGDHGWGRFSPGIVAWTSIRDEFIVRSDRTVNTAYRFRVAGDAYAELNASEESFENIGIHDVAGRIVSPDGKILDSQSFAQVGRLALGDYSLENCSRQTLASTLCQVKLNPAAISPFFVLHDFGSGEFLGTYRPVNTTHQSGCVAGAAYETLTYRVGEVLPMGDGRSLVSDLRLSGGIKCSLQIWTLHGT
jgi:hypothetical protein